MSEFDHEVIQRTPAGYSLKVKDLLGIAVTVMGATCINIGQGLQMVGNELYAAARHEREQEDFAHIVGPLILTGATDDD